MPAVRRALPAAWLVTLASCAAPTPAPAPPRPPMPTSSAPAPAAPATRLPPRSSRFTILGDVPEAHWDFAGQSLFAAGGRLGVAAAEAIAYPPELSRGLTPDEVGSIEAAGGDLADQRLDRGVGQRRHVLDLPLPQ